MPFVACIILTYIAKEGRGGEGAIVGGTMLKRILALSTDDAYKTEDEQQKIGFRFF